MGTVPRKGIKSNPLKPRELKIIVDFYICLFLIKNGDRPHFLIDEKERSKKLFGIIIFKKTVDRCPNMSNYARRYGNWSQTSRRTFKSCR
jgi:hypothetical protein